MTVQFTLPVKVSVSATGTALDEDKIRFGVDSSKVRKLQVEKAQRSRLVDETLVVWENFPGWHVETKLQGDENRELWCDQFFSVQPEYVFGPLSKIIGISKE